MNLPSQYFPKRLAVLLAVLSLIGAELALAHAHGRGGHSGGGSYRASGGVHTQSSTRAPSSVGTSAPAGSVSSTHAGTRYHFHDGVWYRSYRGYYYSVLPPVGLYTAWLPPYYATYYYDGYPYYYLNGAYYRSTPGGFWVVDAPPGAATLDPNPPAGAAAPNAPAAAGVVHEFVIYPRNGQSPAQMDTDRAQCNRWASEQAGASTDAALLQRAVVACMDGRGYTLR